jgi:hypothetical protein
LLKRSGHLYWQIEPTLILPVALVVRPAGIIAAKKSIAISIHDAVSNHVLMEVFGKPFNH